MRRRGRRAATLAIVNDDATALACLKVLARHGAHLDARDGTGRSPAFLAANHGMMCSLRFLLGCGASMEAPGGLWLDQVASRSGHGECAALILSFAQRAQLDLASRGAPAKPGRRGL